MKNKNASPIQQLFSFLCFVAVFILGGFSHSLAQKAQLVKEFDSTFGEIGNSYPSGFKKVGSTIFFKARDLQHGGELWQTDGTTEGTILFSEVEPGSASGFPTIPIELNGELIVFAWNEPHGNEPMKIDPVTKEVSLIKDINPGLGPAMGYSSTPSDHRLVQVGDTLYFNAYEFVHGCELWKTDGTEPGTVLIKDINLFTLFPNAPCPIPLLNYNDRLIFSSYDSGIQNNELWITDGTPEGTEMIKDIYPGLFSGLRGNPVILNGHVYFSAHDGIHGPELWRTDGTEAGTFMVKDILPGSQSSNPRQLIVVDNTLFFVASDALFDRELWKSDGTEAGTVLVKNINLSESSLGLSADLTNVSGTLFFKANDGIHGENLWKSDGTEAGTVLVKQIAPSDLTAVGDTLFFRVGDQIWKSNGTEAGTVIVKDMNSPNHTPRNFAGIDGILYFQAHDPVHGWEFWKSDGTEAGTVLVKDINPISNPQSSGITNLTDFNGTFLFTGYDSTAGTEIWTSNGVESGTFLWADINPGNGSSFPRTYTEFNNSIYFQATDGTSEGTGIWKTDGTEIGTSFIKNVILTDPIVVNDKIFFKLNDSTHGLELGVSDGTETGTILAKDIRPGGNCPNCPHSSYPDNFTDVNGTLFFEANDGVHGEELWKSDGTEAGTVMVKNIDSGPNNSIPSFSSFENVNGTLFFKAQETTYGAELWKSDGTEAGTVLVKDIWSGESQPGSPHNGGAEQITNVNGTAFFIATEPVHGTELWKSDGTEAGTTVVKDIFTGTGSSHPDFLTNVDGTLFFTATDPTFELALWKSDGTTEGTVRIAYVRGLLGPIANHNGTLYFTANDGIHGTELWKSDGTEEGTIIADDINPFVADSFPKDLTVSGDHLFFLATRWDVGEELFSLKLSEDSNDVVLNLPGTGVTVLFNDNSSSNVLHADTATAIAVADVDDNGEDDVVVSFPAGTGPDSNGGTYISRNQGALVSLDTKTAEQITVGDFDGNGQDDLLLDYGVDGISLWINDSFGLPFIPMDPSAMAAGDIDNSGHDDMALSLPGIGTFGYKNFSGFVLLDSSTAEALEVADVDNNGEGDVIVSFTVGNGPGGTGGTYISRNESALVLLDSKTAAQITSGDFDGNGQSDLMLDFGVNGVSLWINDTSAVPLIPLDPVAIAAGDLDNNGQDDMIFSFDGNGTVAVRNFTTVDVLDPAVALDLATGNVDAN